jgi:AraC-like DNA-binding protein
MQDFTYTAADQSLLLSYEKQTTPALMVSNHWHDSYELYYLLSGERYYFIRNQTYFLEKGSLVLIQPQELHRTLGANVSSWERVLINFRAEFLISSSQERFRQLTALFQRDYRLIRFPLKDQPLVEEILFQMLHEASHQENGFHDMLAAQLIRLLVLAARLNPMGSEPPVANLDRWQHSRAAPVVQYLNDHYQESLTLAGLAEQFHLSPFYLCKVFRAATGFTLIEYLNQVRIREAQNLLRQTRSSILNVAGAVGFGSISHFGRVFKVITGVSPLTYRRRYQ